jgi:hypothetical protein
MCRADASPTEDPCKSGEPGSPSNRIHPLANITRASPLSQQKTGEDVLIGFHNRRTGAKRNEEWQAPKQIHLSGWRNRRCGVGRLAGGPALARGWPSYRPRGLHVPPDGLVAGLGLLLGALAGCGRGPGMGGGCGRLGSCLGERRQTTAQNYREKDQTHFHTVLIVAYSGSLTSTSLESRRL